MLLRFPLKGSIQSPTYGPDGKSFLFTRYRGGYTIGAADLYITDLRDRERMTCITAEAGVELGGCSNVASPGFLSTWNADGWIIFSTDFGGLPWPAKIRPNGDGFAFLPGRADGYAGHAPTWSPSGEEFAFERRTPGDDMAQIVIAMTDGLSAPQSLVVSSGDSRNPSWSPDGTMLAWQTRASGEDWRIAVHHIENHDTKTVSPKGKSFFQPTWHPDSERILAAGDNALYEITTLGAVKPVYAVEHPRTAYLGAASWCPEQSAGGRRRLLCEGSDRDNPDGGPGTWLEIY